MPYVSRGDGGKIEAIFLKPQPNAAEFLPNDHPDLLAFFDGMLPASLNETTSANLDFSDIGFIRVLEDLIDLLIAKNILTFTELPEKAREKILNRKDVRERLSGDNDLVVPDEGLL